MVVAVVVFVFANPHYLLPHKAACKEATLEAGKTSEKPLGGESDGESE